MRNYRLGKLFFMNSEAGQSPHQRRIVDAHHHLWDLSKNYHPWLCDATPIPFRYGDYTAIRKNYLLADYLNDAQNYQIQGSVYVETEWDPLDDKGEALYFAEMRKVQRLPTVAVMHVRLDDLDAEEKLEFQSQFNFVRSIRHKPKAHANPGSNEPGGMENVQWRIGFDSLSRLGLRFDLQTPWWHMHEAHALASAYPETSIIINHSGLPADRSSSGLLQWKQAMQKVSECPNVSIKISGIGIPKSPWTIAANGRIVETLIELFGIARCMFASNFPVDKVCASFDEIYGGFEKIVASFTEQEKDMLFRSNANRIYAMGLE